VANRGYFIITDISGYTAYLTESELDHAQAILQSLFDAQLSNIAFPLKISGFQGDAIFMYTPENAFVNPQTFLETLENLYIVFSETLRQMQFNTTCPCNACKNIRNLDLKMCIHYGEYLVQELGGREELLGPDVIVPHRMLKNTVIERTGVAAYALFSDAAARALGLSDLCAPLIPHTESYEHLGELDLLVYDLRAAWEREQARSIHLVDLDTAWIKVEADLPYPPSVIWGYLTVPELEVLVSGLDSVTRTDELGGRTQMNSTFHCAHSAGDFINRIVDWKPFDYYTTHQRGLGFDYYRTIRLTPTESGSSFSMAFTTPEGATEELRRLFEPLIRQGAERLAEVIAEDVARGVIAVG